MNIISFNSGSQKDSRHRTGTDSGINLRSATALLHRFQNPSVCETTGAAPTEGDSQPITGSGFDTRYRSSHNIDAD